MTDFVKDTPSPRLPDKDHADDLNAARGLAVGLMISVVFWLLIGFGVATAPLDLHGGLHKLVGAAEATLHWRDEQQAATRHQAHAGRGPGAGSDEPRANEVLVNG
jgi:hypothetical protein